jgi:hypothetical protein
MSDGDLSLLQNECRDRRITRAQEIANSNPSSAIDVDLRCCELKFEDERKGRFAKIHLDKRTNQSV